MKPPLVALSSLPRCANDQSDILSLLNFAGMLTAKKALPFLWSKYNQVELSAFHHGGIPYSLSIICTIVMDLGGRDSGILLEE